MFWRTQSDNMGRAIASPWSERTLFSPTVSILRDTSEYSQIRARCSLGSEPDFRKKYPAEYRTADGRWVRSKSEKIVADWLYEHGIRYEYERRLTNGVACDFYLPDTDTYIEYWGRDDETYRRHRREKEQFYSKHGFKLVSLDESDLKHVDDILRSKLGQARPMPKAVVSSGKPQTSGLNKRIAVLIAVLVISSLILGYSLAGPGAYWPRPAITTPTTSPITTTSEAIARSESVTTTFATSSATSSIRKWISDEPVISYLDAKKYIGQTKTVEGTIVMTLRYEKGNVIFLDFHDPYEGYFQVIIWREYWKNFPFAPEVFYKGKEVRVTGLIKEYKGSPQIEVTSPKQIEVAYMGFSYPSPSSLGIVVLTTRILVNRVPSYC
jgi:hypothetical protein